VAPGWGAKGEGMCMRGRWTLASPLLILAAIAVVAVPPLVSWAAGGVVLIGVALLAGYRVSHRRRHGHQPGRGRPGLKNRL
jgi:hypothetical protein